MKYVLFFLGIALAGAVVGGSAGSQYVSAVVPDPGTHGPWYASRATGLVSYVCIWFSLAGGLLMSSAWFDGIVARARLLALHQGAAIAGIVLAFVHALLLIPDQWTHFGARDLFVPFASYYEPAMTGLGTTSLYLGAIVTGSFWFRTHIGLSTWRRIHYMSLVVFFGALWHGLAIGSDADTAPVRGLYLATSLSLVTGLVVRLTYARPQRSRAPQPAATPARVAARPQRAVAAAGEASLAAIDGA